MTLDQIQLVLTFLGVIFIWQQLRSQVKQMKFEAFTQLEQELNKPDIRDALEIVYTSDSNQLTHLRGKELKKVESLVHMFELIGFRLKHKALPDAAVEILSPTLFRLWPKLKLFLDKEKERRGGIPYNEDIRYLVKRAEEYQKRSSDYSGHEPVYFKREVEEEQVSPPHDVAP
jgi:hypothetical protein